MVPGREPAELAEHVTGLPTDTAQFHTKLFLKRTYLWNLEK